MSVTTGRLFPGRHVIVRLFMSMLVSMVMTAMLRMSMFLVRVFLVRMIVLLFRIVMMVMSVIMLVAALAVIVLLLIVFLMVMSFMLMSLMLRLFMLRPRMSMIGRALFVAMVMRVRVVALGGQQFFLQRVDFVAQRRNIRLESHLLRAGKLAEDFLDIVGNGFGHG